MHSRPAWNSSALVRWRGGHSSVRNLIMVRREIWNWRDFWRAVFFSPKIPNGIYCRRRYGKKIHTDCSQRSYKLRSVSEELSVRRTGVHYRNSYFFLNQIRQTISSIVKVWAQKLLPTFNGDSAFTFTEFGTVLIIPINVSGKVKSEKRTWSKSTN